MLPMMLGKGSYFSNRNSWHPIQERQLFWDVGEFLILVGEKLSVIHGETFVSWVHTLCLLKVYWANPLLYRNARTTDASNTC